MAPLPPVDHTAVVRVREHIATHELQNVFHIGWTSGVATDADMAELAFNVWTMYAALMDGTGTGGTHYISSDCVLDSVTATDLSSPTAAFGEHDATLAGLATQVAIASNALCLSHKVARRFRGGHCRTYIGGITPDNTTDGRTWTNTARNDIANWWTSQLGSDVLSVAYPNIGGLYLAMVSYIDRAVNPVPPYRRTVPSVDRVLSTTGDLVIRSQRRRVRSTPTPT